MNIPKIDLPRVVIVGGGFSGLRLARRINTQHIQVVLIDKNNYHTFQPLLYQVATAGLEPDSIAYPLRKILSKKKRTHIRMADVNRVDPDKKVVYTSIGEISYNYLVVATGAETNFFGLADVEKYSMSMKQLTEGLDLRSLILQNFEHALNLKNIDEQDSYMNFVVVGGGPTGVELAGALAELKNNILPVDFPDLDIRRMQIHLLEMTDRVLVAMSEKSSESSEEFLKDLGVNVWLNTAVENFDGDTVHTNNGTFQTKTLIWAAGVKATPIAGLEEATLKNGRIEVNEFNQTKKYNNIFAVGDVALMKTEEFPNGHPQLASVAQQQGKHLAKNLNLLSHKKKNMLSFKYKDQGTMATVGRNKAVVDFPRFSISGFFAWLTWMLVHLMLLVDFRNRMIVFVNWLWSYIRYDRGTRLIVRKYTKKKE